MKRVVALSLLVLVGLAGCGKPKPVVVLDSWWDIGVAKKACQSAKDWMAANQALVAQKGCDLVKGCAVATKQSQACASDDTGGDRDFETRLAARFAAASACENVEFVQVKSPNEERQGAGDANLRWQLMLGFVPGAPTQIWELTGPSSEYAKSAGTADDIPTKVCAIVGGKGATTVY